MTFDDRLKTIIEWDKKAFHYLMLYFQNVLTNEAASRTPQQLREAYLMFQVCKQGFGTSQNLINALGKLVFTAGDEDSQVAEQEIADQLASGYVSTTGQLPAPVAKSTVLNDEVDFLNKLYLLGETKKDEVVNNGVESNSGTVSDDWYRRIFGREGGIRTDGGTQDISGSASQ